MSIKTLSKPTTSRKNDRNLQTVRNKHLAQVPRKQRAAFLRAWEGKSRKSAVRAMCLECMGYQAGEIPLCTSPTCPLYEFREGL